MSSWSEFLANVSSPTTPSLSVPAVVASPPLANRHLLLVEVADNISRSEIAKCKRENTDVIYVSRETIPLLYGQLQDFNMKWRSINLLFHGSADLEEKSITMFGVKMTMDRSIMMEDPNVVNWVRLLKTISIFASDSIYIYTCAIGMIDGLKELCIHLDKACNLKHGLYLSTNNTGQAPNGDWRMEWGTKTGFLIDGIHTNEIEHAENDLFDDIDGLTFELALLTTTTGNTSDKGGYTAAQVGALTNAQITALTTALLGNFTATQLQALKTGTTGTTGLISKISSATTGANAFAIRGIIANAANGNLGMNAFTAAQIPSFTTAVIGQLTAAQIGILGSTKIQAMTPAQIAAISTVNDPAGLKPVNALRMADFNTAARIQSLSATQIPVLSMTQIQALSPTQIGQLLDAQFNALTSSQFGWMSSEDIAAITTARIQSLNVAEIQAISTVADAAGLKPVNALRMVDFNTVVLIQSLSATQIQALSATQIQALASTQIQALASTQIQALASTQIQAISTFADAAGLKPVNALRMSDFNTAALIQSLSAWQIPHLSDTQFNAITSTQFGFMTNTQVAAITTARIQSLSDSNISVLFDKLYFTQLRSLNKLVMYKDTKVSETQATMISNGTVWVPPPKDTSVLSGIFRPDNFAFDSTITNVQDEPIKYLHADVYKRIMDFAASDITNIYGTICKGLMQTEMVYANRIDIRTIPADLFKHFTTKTIQSLDLKNLTQWNAVVSNCITKLEPSQLSLIPYEFFYMMDEATINSINAMNTTSIFDSTVYDCIFDSTVGDGYQYSSAVLNTTFKYDSLGVRNTKVYTDNIKLFDSSDIWMTNADSYTSGRLSYMLMQYKNSAYVSPYSDASGNLLIESRFNDWLDYMISSRSDQAYYGINGIFALYYEKNNVLSVLSTGVSGNISRIALLNLDCLKLLDKFICSRSAMTTDIKATLGQFLIGKFGLENVWDMELCSSVSSIIKSKLSGVSISLSTKNYKSLFSYVNTSKNRFLTEAEVLAFGTGLMNETVLRNIEYGMLDPIMTGQFAAMCANGTSLVPGYDISNFLPQQMKWIPKTSFTDANHVRFAKLIVEQIEAFSHEQLYLYLDLITRKSPVSGARTKYEFIKMMMPPTGSNLDVKRAWYVNRAKSLSAGHLVVIKEFNNTNAAPDTMEDVSTLDQSLIDYLIQDHRTEYDEDNDSYFPSQLQTSVIYNVASVFIFNELDTEISRVKTIDNVVAMVKNDASNTTLHKTSIRYYPYTYDVTNNVINGSPFYSSDLNLSVSYIPTPFEFLAMVRLKLLPAIPDTPTTFSIYYVNALYRLPPSTFSHFTPADLIAIPRTVYLKLTTPTDTGLTANEANRRNTIRIVFNYILRGINDAFVFDDTYFNSIPK